MRTLYAGFAVVALALAACESSTEPVPSVAGLWTLIAYRDDTTNASAVSGIISFAAGGVMSVNVHVTYPGEPEDSVVGTWSWSQNGSQLLIDDGADQSVWQLTFAGDRLTLDLQEGQSTTRLVLQRQVAPGAPRARHAPGHLPPR